MAVAPVRTVAALLAALLLAWAAAVSADDHDETIRKVDIVEIGQSGLVDTSVDIASAGQPNGAAIKVLRDSGYVAVIDLRGPDEQRGYDEQTLVEKNGMSYSALPVTSADDFSFEKAAELDALISSFDGPVLVHCGSGNRVGALLALRARQNGATADEAIEIGKAAGLGRSEDLVRQVIDTDD